MNVQHSTELEASSEARDSVSELILAAQNGDLPVWDSIYMILYEDLRRIAAKLAKQQKTLRSPTSLVSEGWLRLCGAELTLESRSHLTSLVARAMRFVLIDEARRALTDKHGHGVAMVGLWEAENLSDGLGPEKLIILNQALVDLEKVDPRLVQVVELRFFGGLQEDEIAERLGLSLRTIRRDWRKARAYLFSSIGSPMFD